MNKVYSIFYREKEHEKLLSHSDPVKGVHYGNLGGASEITGGSVSSLGTKSLSQGGTSKDKYLKSLSVCISFVTAVLT
jgi:hypothetical protein